MHHGPKQELVVNKTTKMDIYGCDMPNDSNCALFLDSGGVVRPYGGNMKNWRFCNYGNFGDKNHRFHLPA